MIMSPSPIPSPPEIVDIFRHANSFMRLFVNGLSTRRKLNIFQIQIDNDSQNW